MNYKDLKYSVYYFPGAGGLVVNWMIGITQDVRLLHYAMESFPLSLKNNQQTIWINGKPVAGWIFHEVDHRLNPYSRSIAIYMNTREKAINNILSLSNTKNILIDTDPKLRLRMCYEKKAKPFNKGNIIVNKKQIMYELNEYKNRLNDLKENKDIHKVFRFSTIFNCSYVTELEQILEYKLSHEVVEALNTLINRYININSLKKNYDYKLQH